MKRYFEHKTGFVQLLPGIDNGFCGHNLGFPLYDLAETEDPLAKDVYHALTQGPTHGLRSMETGVNVSAIARFWKLGI